MLRLQASIKWKIWKVMREFRRARAVEQLLFAELCWWIRASADNFPLPGAEKFKDNLVLYAAASVVNKTFSDDDRGFREINSEAIEKLRVEALNTTATAETIRQYFRLRKHLATLCFTEEARSVWLKSIPAGHETLQPLHKKDLRSIAKESRSRIRQLHDGITDRIGIRWEWSTSSVLSSLSLYSTAIALSGYVYTRIFFGVLGVEPNLYFDLSDYLSTSIEQIHTAVFGAMGAGASYIHGKYRSSRDPSHLSEKQARRGLYVLSLCYIGMVSGSVAAYLQNDYSWPRLATAPALLLSFACVDHIIKKTIKNREAVEFHANFLVAFLVFLCSHALFEAKAIESGRPASNTKVILKDGTLMEPSNYIILGRTSRYLIVWRKSDSTTLALPLDKIDKFESKARRLG